MMTHQTISRLLEFRMSRASRLKVSASSLGSKVLKSLLQVGWSCYWSRSWSLSTWFQNCFESALESSQVAGVQVTLDLGLYTEALKTWRLLTSFPFPNSNSMIVGNSNFEARHLNIFWVLQGCGMSWDHIQFWYLLKMMKSLIVQS